MKLIIDIPDTEYETCRKYHQKDHYGSFESIALTAIANGIPFEKCGDYISREAAKDAICKIHPVDMEFNCTLIDKVDIMYVLNDLSPVIPKQTFNGMTNGEVISTIFPYVDTAIEELLNHPIWWNESYKGVEE